MNKSSKLPYVLLAIAFIWLAILSQNLSSLDHKTDTEQVIQQDVTGFSTDFTRIVDENSAAVPSILTENGTSTGFVYRQDNDTVYILTAYHSVADATRLNVQFGTYRCEAILKGYDPLIDLAVLEIKTPYQIPVLKTGDASLLKRGEYVILIGTPLSQEYAGSVRTGMIASSITAVENSLTYDEQRYDYYLDVIQVSAELENGYSGSPVLNMAGEVTGMITMAPESQLSFAVSINEIRKVADLIIADTEVHRNLYGIKEIYVHSMENYEKSNLGLNVDTISGIYAQRVREASLAYEAGVRTGDVITAINDIPIDDLDDYLDLCYGNYENFTFTVLRNGETHSLGVIHD